MHFRAIASRGLGLEASASKYISILMDMFFTLVELYNIYSSSPVTMDKHISKNVSQNAYVRSGNFAFAPMLEAHKLQMMVHLCTSRDNTTNFHMIVVKVYKGVYQCD
jgi:hypothetical protein